MPSSQVLCVAVKALFSPSRSQAEQEDVVAAIEGILDRPAAGAAAGKLAVAKAVALRRKGTGMREMHRLPEAAVALQEARLCIEGCGSSDDRAETERILVLAV